MALKFYFSRDVEVFRRSVAAVFAQSIENPRAQHRFARAVSRAA